MVFPNVLVNVHFANGHIRGSERTCTGVGGGGGVKHVSLFSFMTHVFSTLVSQQKNKTNCE